MATSVKLGVDVSAFKSGIKDAQANVKALGAELKRNEAQFKATGNAEQYLTDKTRLLKMQMTAQKNEINNLEQALSKMRSAGVVPTSAAYQNMQRQLAEAQTNLLNMSVELNNVATSEQNAAKGADQLASSVSGISKKMSLEQVANGLSKITSGLESAAKKAVELGKALWDNVMEKAAWADDSMTMAMMYGVNLEEFLQVQKLVQNGMDTTVDAILGSQQKLRKGIGSGSEDIKNILLEFGLASAGGKEGTISIIDQDSVDLFWEAGRALMEMGDEFKQEDYAQKLFGKSWRELIPLFETFANQDEYKAGLKEVNANTEEEVSALAELNDAVGKLKGNFDTLETKILAGLAPALTDAADAMSALLDKVLAYLDTPEGQKALKDMETAVSGLFEDLGKIDPEKVVSGFTEVFNSIVGGLQWMVDNKSTLEGILGGIVTAWGAAKLTGGALTVLQLINGLNTLRDKGVPDLPGTTPTTPTTGGGGSGGGWWTNLINGISGKVASIGTAGLQNLGLVYDWIMHGTPFGQMLTNGGSLQDAINTQLGSAKETGKNIWGNMGKTERDSVHEKRTASA